MAWENKHFSSLWRVLKEYSWKMNTIKHWLLLLAIKNLLLKQGFQWQRHSFTSNPVAHFVLDFFAFDPQPSIFPAGHLPPTLCSEFMGAHFASHFGTAVCWWTYHQVTAAFPLCVPGQPIFSYSAPLWLPLWVCYINCAVEQGINAYPLHSLKHTVTGWFFHSRRGKNPNGFFH